MWLTKVFRTALRFAAITTSTSLPIVAVGLIDTARLYSQCFLGQCPRSTIPFGSPQTFSPQETPFYNGTVESRITEESHGDFYSETPLREYPQIIIDNGYYSHPQEQPYSSFGGPRVLVQLTDGTIAEVDTSSSWTMPFGVSRSFRTPSWNRGFTPTREDNRFTPGVLQPMRRPIIQERRPRTTCVIRGLLRRLLFGSPSVS